MSIQLLNTDGDMLEDGFVEPQIKTAEIIDNEGVEESATTATLNEFVDEGMHYNYDSAEYSLFPDAIGLRCLPVQKRLYALKKGVNFTMMLVGESGVGKTSFVNTLFDTVAIKPVSEYRPSPDKTTEIIPYKMELQEEGFDLRLTVIDTPGFGDYIDNRYCWYPIVRYIDEQYRRVVYQENQPDRSNMTHGEVHACLYFIVPSATGLSQIDLEAMKNISTRVNLIPIISKADAFTLDEVNAFKERVRRTLKEHSISICELIDQPGTTNIIKEMPFSIINSRDSYKREKDGKLVRGRKYKWGLAEVENPAHCDFLKLREFLMGQNLSDLIMSTENYHENYRRDFLKYRLGKSMQLKMSKEELSAYETPSQSSAYEIPNSKSSMISGKDSLFPSPNVDLVIEAKESIDVLRMLNALTLKETEKELVEMNPAFLDLEKDMKKKFTEIVKGQNQKFKDWKKALFERQEKFNKDIEQVHKRLVGLQDEIKVISSTAMV